MKRVRVMTVTGLWSCDPAYLRVQLHEDPSAGVAYQVMFVWPINGAPKIGDKMTVTVETIE